MRGDDATPGSGFAAGQLASAFVTALTDPDTATRRRAARRVLRWGQVLEAMASGRTHVGSRAPIAGLPVWATPVVMRGGFVSGAAAAEGPPAMDERALARKWGIAAQRLDLFTYYLTAAGLDRLWALLDSGRYRVDLPEHAALLCVAQLVRAGHVRAAVALVDELQPWADRLRFTPLPAAAPRPDPALVSRSTVGQVRIALSARRPNPRVAAHREALTVWGPVTDRFVTLWLDRPHSDQPDTAWRHRAAELVADYRLLAEEHGLARRHRDPHGTLAVLRAATEDTLAGAHLDAHRSAIVRCRVEGAVARRGQPGSAAHTALRRAQATAAARPLHHDLARIAAARLAPLPPDAGLADPLAYAGPVTAAEANGVPAGTPLPTAVTAALARATCGTVEELVDRGRVSSAEVLAELVPGAVAAAVAAGYPDAATRGLVAATEAAFRNRRSVLITDLSGQVRADELPWLRALQALRDGDDADLRTTLVRVATLAVASFPGTILPNAMVGELRALARALGLDLPWVYEIAADIFTGGFIATVRDAAVLAHETVAGSVYATYFEMDADGLARAADPDGFGALCRARAGMTDNDGWSVAGNGMVLEQAQILTTHNLALLAGPLGVVPPHGWADLARRAYWHAARTGARARIARRPLRSAKTAAYAWRQALFSLSLAGHDAIPAFLAWERDLPLRLPAWVLTGLRDAADERTPARRLLGWSRGEHPLLVGDPGDQWK